MRRPRHPKPLGKIKRRFCILWRECEVCHEEIRFESMWALYADLGIARGLNTVCQKCVPTRFAAAKYFEKHYRHLCGEDIKIPDAPVSTTQVRAT